MNKKNYDSVLKGFEETKTRFDLGSATLYDFQEAQASFDIASQKEGLTKPESHLLRNAGFVIGGGGAVGAETGNFAGFGVCAFSRA